MGRFFLYVATERALAEDCMAVPLVRHGLLDQVLPKVMSEIDATTIIIGHPTDDPSCFQRAEMERVLISMKE